MIKQKGMTVNQVAVEANVPPSSLYSIIQRNSTKVEIDSFIRICNILGCKPEDFSGEILAASTLPPGLSEQEEKILSEYRELDYFGRKAVDELLATEYERCTAPDEDEQPTIKIRHSYYKVSAGTGFELDIGDAWEDTIDVPDSPEARKADYALTIQGNSMEPVFRNNDIILVKQQDTIELGQIGIFVLNGAGYIKKNGGDRLISLNEEFEDIMIEAHDRCQCVGKVICRL